MNTLCVLTTALSFIIAQEPQPLFKIEGSKPFTCDLALQNIPLWKQSFKTQPQIETKDVTWSSQYNLPTTRIKNCRTLSLQEVELDGPFLILHIVLETCTI